jgi:putative membrane protein
VGPALAVRHRLHPLTPLVRGAKFLVVAVGALSWQGYADLGLPRWALTMSVVLVVAIAVSTVSWLVTGYQLVGHELRVFEGLVSRRTRAIPLERVQAVDLVRPFLARVLGLAELRLEVVGGAKTEAPLAYLSVGDAVRLRGQLLALVTGTGDETPAEAPGPPTAEQPVYAVRNRHVLIGQLLTPQAFSLPVGILLVLVPTAMHHSWTFVGLASTVTALVGVVLVPLRRVLADWDFRVSVDATGLRLRHGLLDTRSHTVPPLRVQAVSVTWPLLWRMVALQRTRIDVAGYGAREERLHAGTLLPAGELNTTRWVAGLVLGGAVRGELSADALLDIASLPLTPPPARARWLAPIALPYLGIGLTGDVVASRAGVLTQRLVVVPLARIQSVRVVQGPLQRLLRLATVHVDTAGSMRALGEHRDVDEAYALAATLAARSRAVRARSVRSSGH